MEARSEEAFGLGGYNYSVGCIVTRCAVVSKGE